MCDKLDELQCYNKGCTKRFDPAKNPEDACQYHPGAPIFHDAMKSWSCCKKKSIDFTEFLNIPGCTKAAHSNEKPEPQENKPSKECSSIEKIIKEESTPKAIKPHNPEDRPSANDTMVTLKTTVGSTLKQALDRLIKELTLDSSSSGDAVKINKGSSCRNSACKKTYEDESSDKETCVYHPGSPIFHEGMKFWSCCQRKTSEFDNFLAQEGCTKGDHVWKKKDDLEADVKCRYDWHQTGNFVIMSIFSKVVMPEKTVIEANKVKVNLSIVFDGGKSHFVKEILLKGIIDPENSHVNLLGTKVEIKLKKKEPGSWSTLEFIGQPADISECGITD